MRPIQNALAVTMLNCIVIYVHLHAEWHKERFLMSVSPCHCVWRGVVRVS
ncbi:hypothetical protein OF83DRAFT_1287609 [Amylostereum chailletii]|nr:hypothetical protein OF83DRAFT_1287609 [Amylostereum chailletii]